MFRNLVQGQIHLCLLCDLGQLREYSDWLRAWRPGFGSWVHAFCISFIWALWCIQSPIESVPRIQQPKREADWSLLCMPMLKCMELFLTISYTFMARSSVWRELEDSTTISLLRTVIILLPGLTYANSAFCPWNIGFPMAHKNSDCFS